MLSCHSWECVREESLMLGDSDDEVLLHNTTDEAGSVFSLASHMRYACICFGA